MSARSLTHVNMLAAFGLMIASLSASAEPAHVAADKEAVFVRLHQLGEQNNSEAAFELAHLYGGNGGAPKDENAATEWLRKAAEAGVPLAQFELGMSLQKKDPKESFDWVLKAAKSGLNMAEVTIATAYANGQGIERDPSQAYAWYSIAADDQGKPGEYPVASMAKNYLPILTKRLSPEELKAGEAVAADLKTSIGNPVEARIATEHAAIFERMLDLAQQGNCVAQYRLGGLYTSGTGVASDYTAAFTWYAKSAEGGYVPAELMVGSAYSFGRGVQKDPVQAVAHYRKAAEAGNDDGQMQLGNAYRTGTGVEQNNAEAYFWASLAVQNMAGNPSKLATYRTFPDSIAKTLSRAEIAQQDARRKDWKPTEDN